MAKRARMSARTEQHLIEANTTVWPYASIRHKVLLHACPFLPVPAMTLRVGEFLTNHHRGGALPQAGARHVFKRLRKIKKFPTCSPRAAAVPQLLASAYQPLSMMAPRLSVLSPARNHSRAGSGAGRLPLATIDRSWNRSQARTQCLQSNCAM